MSFTCFSGALCENSHICIIRSFYQSVEREYRNGRGSKLSHLGEIHFGAVRSAGLLTWIELDKILRFYKTDNKIDFFTARIALQKLKSEYCRMDYVSDLLLRFGPLLLNSKTSDMTLFVEGEALPAHRIILATSCDYFR